MLDALLARLLLANGKPLTLPQVSILAGLSEKTVRMAAKKEDSQMVAIGESSNPNLLTYGDRTATLVRADEAQRWLVNRDHPFFNPTRIRGDLNAINLAPRTQNQLATILSTLRQRAGLSLADLAQQLNLSPEQATKYERIEEHWWGPDDIDSWLLDGELLAKLTRVLKVERPLEFLHAMTELLIPYQKTTVRNAD